MARCRQSAILLGARLSHAHPAGAAISCEYDQASSQYHFTYAKQITTQQNVTAVERNISKPTSIGNITDINKQHILFYLSMAWQGQEQTGFGKGILAVSGTATSLKIYGEGYADNSYNFPPEVSWYGNTVTANEFQSVFYDGNYLGAPLYEAHVNDGSDIQTIAPMPMNPVGTNSQYMNALAATEGAWPYGFGDGPPTFAGISYYGGNDSHAYDASHHLDIGTTANPTNWFEWTYSTDNCSGRHYSYYPLHYWSFFKTWTP